MEDFKEYTEEQCYKDERPDNDTRVTYFKHKGDKKAYSVTVADVTLQLSEEIERQDRGTFKEFAALLLNKHLTEEREIEGVKSFFDEISD